MKTYSIKELAEFRSKNREQSKLFAEFREKNRLDWPDGFDFSSQVELNEWQLEKVRFMLCAMKIFQEAEKDLREVLPENTYTQIFGDWNILLIDLVREELETSDEHE